MTANENLINSIFNDAIPTGAASDEKENKLGVIIWSAKADSSAATPYAV